MLITPKLAFKIFAYVQYGDVLEINRVPDFNSQIPITVFFLNEKALLGGLISAPQIPAGFW